MSNLLRETKSWEKGSKKKIGVVGGTGAGESENKDVAQKTMTACHAYGTRSTWNAHTHTHSHTHSRMHPHKLIQRDAKKSATYFSFPFMKWRKNGKGNIEFVPYFDSAWNVCLNGYKRYINGNLYDFVFLYINHCQDSFASKLYKQIECVLCNTYFQMIYDRCQIFNIKYETFYNYYIYAAHTRFA